MVRLLLDGGTDVNLKDKRRLTPLHKAAINGHAQVIGLLLDRGAVCTIPVPTRSPLKIAFSFRGRISRAQFWGALLCLVLVTAALFVVVMRVLSVAAESWRGSDAQLNLEIGLAALPLVLLCCWVSLSVQWNLLHDLGVSGWVTLVPWAEGLICLLLFSLASCLGAFRHSGSPVLAFLLVSIASATNIAGWVAFLVQGSLPGKPGMNRYGFTPGTPLR